MNICRGASRKAKDAIHLSRDGGFSHRLWRAKLCSASLTSMIIQTSTMCINYIKNTMIIRFPRDGLFFFFRVRFESYIIMSSSQQYLLFTVRKTRQTTLCRLCRSKTRAPSNETPLCTTAMYSTHLKRAPYTCSVFRRFEGSASLPSSFSSASFFVFTFVLGSTLTLFSANSRPAAGPNRWNIKTKTQFLDIFFKKMYAKLKPN